MDFRILKHNGFIGETHAVVVRNEKTVRIPYGDEVLIVQYARSRKERLKPLRESALTPLPLLSKSGVVTHFRPNFGYCRWPPPPAVAAISTPSTAPTSSHRLHHITFAASSPSHPPPSRHHHHSSITPPRHAPHHPNVTTPTMAIISNSQHHLHHCNHLTTDAPSSRHHDHATKKGVVGLTDHQQGCIWLPHQAPRDKENHKKDKIGSKLDKNEKRGEAGKSQKQLHLKEEEKPKKTKKEWPKTHTRIKSY
nr:hypothetical protein [Tanacetum cinerariifolium]